MSPEDRRVVGGSLLRKPADRTAALVVSKCPWWARITSTNKPNMTETTELRDLLEKLQKALDVGNKLVARLDRSTGVAICTDFEAVSEKTNANIARYLAAATAGLTQIQKVHTSAVETSTKIGHELAAVVNECNRTEQLTTQFLGGFRQTKTAVVLEVSQMLNPLKELRNFFHGSNYADEMARLKEFVQVLHQLREFSKDGTLDAMEGFMLKLMCSKEASQ